jgi:hypothetical protein
MSERPQNVRAAYLLDRLSGDYLAGFAAANRAAQSRKVVGSMKLNLIS